MSFDTSTEKVRKLIEQLRWNAALDQQRIRDLEGTVRSESARANRLHAACVVAADRAERAEAAMRAADAYRIEDWQKLKSERDVAQSEVARLTGIIQQVRGWLESPLQVILDADDPQPELERAFNAPTEPAPELDAAAPKAGWVCSKCAREATRGYDDGQIPEHHRTCPKRDATEPVVHRCPPQGEGTMPCCNRNPWEVPGMDRLTLDDSRDVPRC